MGQNEANICDPKSVPKVVTAAFVLERYVISLCLSRSHIINLSLTLLDTYAPIHYLPVWPDD